MDAPQPLSRQEVASGIGSSKWDVSRVWKDTVRHRVHRWVSRRTLVSLSSSDRGKGLKALDKIKIIIKVASGIGSSE
jgi:hypothetical protein